MKKLELKPIWDAGAIGSGFVIPDLQKYLLYFESTVKESEIFFSYAVSLPQKAGVGQRTRNLVCFPSSHRGPSTDAILFSEAH